MCASRSQHRILIIDDNQMIHDDFKAILNPPNPPAELATLESQVFGTVAEWSPPIVTNYRVDSAYQGQVGFEKVKVAHEKGLPYSLVVVDMRMPPGWDGLQTLKRIFEYDQTIQAVICTAFSDQSWQEIVREIGHTDRLLILKKPFDESEVSQLAAALTRKYELARKAEIKSGQLETLVRERTQELIDANRHREMMQNAAMENERRMLHAQKLESLGELAGGVAHDFNNLIHVVCCYLQFAMIESREDSGAEQSLKSAMSAAVKAGQVASRILDYSRKETQELKQIDAAHSINEVAELVQPLLGGRHRLELNLCTESQEVFIVAEASLIEQVLVNLCTNARDAMPDGGVVQITSEVKLLGRDDVSRLNVAAGEYLKISVSDAGVGMTDEVKSRVLDPFFTTKELGKGTGLGLSTVHGLVTRHNGALEIESEVDQGTNVHVWLPLAIEEPSDLDKLARRGEIPDSDSLQGNKQLILVADDSDIVRELAEAILTENGYRTLAARDGLEAVEIARNNCEIELFVFDVQMPRLNGRQALKQIRESGMERPTVFCSAFDPYVSDDHSAFQSEWETLSKPFDANELLWVVHSLLERAGEQSIR